MAATMDISTAWARERAAAVPVTAPAAPELVIAMYAGAAAGTVATGAGVASARERGSNARATLLML